MNPSISLHPHLLALHVQATLPESNRERLLALVVVVGALPPNQPPG